MTKRTFVIIALIVLASIVCVGVGVFTFINRLDPTANASTIEDATRDFVSTVQNEDWEGAYALTATPFRQSISQEQFQQITEEQLAFALVDYQGLELCDWAVLNSNGQTVLQGSGLLTYGQDRERVVFSSSVVKEEDLWKILGFEFLLDSDPVPFGRCTE